ncbi:class I SAM-dependent methyltransferase [Streptomyces bikiniensis]|uniref:class I SAM-dependent methyltransferase n=1 Tax=Streptomyces bikiniensis TaxID=1896 RepID=UPI00389A8EBF
MASARAGARQVVLLGAGLDSRTFPARRARRNRRPRDRLDRRAGLQPVGARRHGAEPVAEHRPCAADLRQDWATPRRPTAGSSPRPAVPDPWGRAGGAVRPVAGGTVLLV